MEPEPGEGRTSAAHRTGSREIVLVALGAVTIAVGAAEPVTVERGQSAMFRADEPHSYRNATTSGDVRARGPRTEWGRVVNGRKTSVDDAGVGGGSMSISATDWLSRLRRRRRRVRAMARLPGRPDRRRPRRGPHATAAEQLLADAHRYARAAAPGHVDPHTARWHDAYRDVGLKPRVARPSSDALFRRAASEKGLPSIDVLVDLYNAISILHAVPIGGEDLDRYDGPARLVIATGDEPFLTSSDGRPTIDHPEPGEPVWVDDTGVTCRRWNWRQTTRTAIDHQPRVSGSSSTASTRRTLGRCGRRPPARRTASRSGDAHPRRHRPLTEGRPPGSAREVPAVNSIDGLAASAGRRRGIDRCEHRSGGVAERGELIGRQRVDDEPSSLPHVPGCGVDELVPTEVGQPCVDTMTFLRTRDTLDPPRVLEPPHGVRQARGRSLGGARERRHRQATVGGLGELHEDVVLEGVEARVALQLCVESCRQHRQHAHQRLPGIEL
ncbi:MAG: phenylalanine--tRNA ligase beta subunit-related protein [Ilumatobacteraceae bacterium]